MENIMRIPAAMEPFNAEFRKVKSLEKQNRPISKSPAQVDKSEFSSDARRLSNIKSQAEAAAAHAIKSPEIRFDKVELAKQRVETGYYDRPEVREALAEKIMDDFGIKDQENE